MREIVSPNDAERWNKPCLCVWQPILSSISLPFLTHFSPSPFVPSPSLRNTGVLSRRAFSPLLVSSRRRPSIRPFLPQKTRHRWLRGRDAIWSSSTCRGIGLSSRKEQRRTAIAQKHANAPVEDTSGLVCCHGSIRLLVFPFEDLPVERRSSRTSFYPPRTGASSREGNGKGRVARRTQVSPLESPRREVESVHVVDPLFLPSQPIIGPRRVVIIPSNRSAEYCSRNFPNFH